MEALQLYLQDKVLSDDVDENINATKTIDKLIHACRETIEIKSQNNLDIKILSGDETRRAY